MTRFRYLAVVFLGLLAIIEVVMVWRPFGVHAVSYQTGSKGGKVAGEIVRGFHLVQSVPANLYSPSRKRNLSVHWHNPDSLGRWTTPNCFSIRFASYSRKNRGDLYVGWQQGAASQQWRIHGAGVRNAYADFCPAAGLDTKAPFQIEVRGIDGTTGSAPTVWLARSALPAAEVNGRQVGNRGLNLRLVYARTVGRRAIMGVSKGAFAFGCACSLGIGLIALLAVRRKRYRAVPDPGDSFR